MIPESYSTVYCRVFTKPHCDTDVCCAAHQPEGIFHFTQTLKLTSRCKEAYVSSLHIFRAYSYSHSSSREQHSHSLCLPDQIGEDRRTPWLCPRDGERVREGEKCPLSQCHRERSWHSVYVTRPVRSGRPPCNINSHLEQLWLRAWNIEQNSCHGSTAVLPACTVC